MEDSHILRNVFAREDSFKSAQRQFLSLGNAAHACQHHEGIWGDPKRVADQLEHSLL